MTEVEKWLKKYGKPSTVTNKSNTRTSTSTAPKRDINERIKERLKNLNLNTETMEEKIQRKMDQVPSDYHPGVHTKSLNIPIYRAQKFINAEIQDILYYNGEIMDIKTTGTTMLGFQTMHVLILYKMPGWNRILEKEF